MAHHAYSNPSRWSMSLVLKGSENRSGHFWFEHAMYLHCYLTKFIGVIMIICLSILAHGLNLKYAFRFIPNKTPLLHWYDLLMTQKTCTLLHCFCTYYVCQWLDTLNIYMYCTHANHMTMTTSGQI